MAKKNQAITGTAYKQKHREKIWGILLKILMVVSMVLCAWITDVGLGLGIISNAKAGENWPTDFTGYGELLILGSVLLTIAGVIVWIRWNIAAMITASAGITGTLVSWYHIMSYASDSGFYSRIYDMNVSTLYTVEILPTLIVWVSIVLLGIIQVTSWEAREKRLQKKIAAEAVAPSVLGEPVQEETEEK